MTSHQWFDPEAWTTLPVGRAAYSDRAAWVMAQISALAYEDDIDLVRSEIKNAGFTHVVPFQNEQTDTQGFVTWGEKHVVVAFRGTEEKTRDILTDLDAHFAKTSYGPRHEGFYRAYASVKEAVQVAILSAPHHLPIYLTGHSLGGALAVVAASEEECDRLAACYTFGGPRVGKKDLDFELACPVYRIVNGNDIVPLVPLLSMGYRHAGVELRLINGRVYRKSNFLIDGILFSIRTACYLGHQIVKLFRVPTLPPGLEDHRIANYVTQIHKATLARMTYRPKRKMMDVTAEVRAKVDLPRDESELSTV